MIKNGTDKVRYDAMSLNSMRVMYKVRRID
jgi:hypothetical protein